MPRLILACALALLAALPAMAQPNLNGGNFLFPDFSRRNPGQSFTFSYSFANSGTQASPPTQVAFYFSADRFPSDDDVLLGRQPIAGIGVQSNAFGSATLTVPQVPRGGYVFLAVVDDPDIVMERDETDNVSYGRLTVGGDANGPDLVFSAASLEDATVAPGGRVSVEYTILNQGRTDVGDFEVGYYLGVFNQPQAPLTLLERETLGGLDAGEDNDESEQFTIPASTAPGQYYILILADDRNLVEESDETNNGALLGGLTVTGTTASEPTVGRGFELAVRPNPSAGAVRLSYELPEARAVRLAIFDSLGREVTVVAVGPRTAGAHTAGFDTAGLPAGLYVARLTAGAETAIARFAITR